LKRKIQKSLKVFFEGKNKHYRNYSYSAAANPVAKLQDDEANPSHRVISFYLCREININIIINIQKDLKLKGKLL
jgi:translation initiation factor 2 beta subunit (eIF-2beta)/eIF-5